MWTAAYPRGRRPRAAVVLLGLLIFVPGSVSLGAEEPAARPRTVSEERVELFLALLKRRALQALEAHREAPPPMITASTEVSQGYESNVFLDGARRGDFFTQEATSVTVSPRLTPWLAGELTYDLLHTHYADLRDANLWMNTMTAVLKLIPHRRLTGELRYEFGIVNFPFDTSNSFFDHRTGFVLRLAQTRWLTHKTGWTYQRREYDTRKARDTEGNDRVAEDRQDGRHTVSYDLLLRWPKTSVRVGGQVYRNFSNDQFQDFYDWADVQLQGVVSQVLSRRWVTAAIGTHERRNYHRRNVPNVNTAERDNLLTLAGSLIYLLNANMQVGYSLTYRHQDSNDPRLDFIDWVNEARLSVSF